MSLQPGAPETAGQTQFSQKGQHETISGYAQHHYLEHIQPNYPAYKSLIGRVSNYYKALHGHDLELFARSDSRQRPIVEKNLQDDLGSLFGGVVILSSEIKHTIEEAAKENGQTVTIGSFFKQVIKDERESNLLHSLSILATSSFEGFTLADTMARYVYGVKSEPADTKTRRELQQQDIPQSLEKLLDTQIPIDVVRSTTQRLQKNLNLSFSMLLQEVAKSYPPFMDNVAENLLNTQPAEQQSAQLMLDVFQKFIATYPTLRQIPSWERWYRRIRRLRKPKLPSLSLTPRDMKQIKKLMDQLDKYNVIKNNAPSQIGELSINDAMSQIRKRCPKGIIVALEEIAKTNTELDNQPFMGRLPLSPDQEKYLEGVRKEDRDRMRYSLEEDNYTLDLFQRFHLV